MFRNVMRDEISSNSTIAIFTLYVYLRYLYFLTERSVFTYVFSKAPLSASYTPTKLQFTDHSVKGISRVKERISAVFPSCSGACAYGLYGAYYRHSPVVPDLNIHPSASLHELSVGNERPRQGDPIEQREMRHQ